MDTIKVHINQGLWISGYEPHDMPGAWCRTQYEIKSKEGMEALRDGTYKAIVLEGNVLRILCGGEYFNGNTINYSTYDYDFIFDEAFHDEFYEGVARGYKGKRRCNNEYLWKKSRTWLDGYHNGLRGKELCAAA